VAQEPAVAEDRLPHRTEQGEQGDDRLLGPYYCRTCALAQDSAVRSLVPCQRYMNHPATGNLNSYCLPLVHSNQPIALLQFALAGNAPLSVDQMRFLNNVAPAMELAVEAARPQRSASIQAEATEVERQRIARELHDSLAQNIAYLRLKLDMLIGEDALHEIAAVHQQLEQMRDVADQAYQQVRGTLVNLRPEGSPDLRAALLKLAKSFDERAGFKVYFSSEGTPFVLAQEQQVHNIVQEALTNVEKHAGATQVNIGLRWTKDHLEITVTDDGRGFEPASIQANGHYGLSIMRERAHSIGAKIKVTSGAGQGTHITLSIPRNAGTGWNTTNISNTSTHP
jgi:two-component system nitrate/nitrite sensor histidine kinase NarX